MGWQFWKQDRARVQDAPRGQDGPRLQDSVPGRGFALTVEDVFSITGRGTIVTGRVTAGTIRIGDTVLITRAGQQFATSRITGVEAFRKKLIEAHAGDNVGLLLEGIPKDLLLRGDSITN